MLPNLKEVWQQLHGEEVEVPPLLEDPGIKSAIKKLWKLASGYVKKSSSKALRCFYKLLEEEFVMFKVETKVRMKWNYFQIEAVFKPNNRR